MVLQQHLRGLIIGRGVLVAVEQRALLQVGVVVFAAPVDELQKNGRDDGGGDDDQYHRAKEVLLHQSRGDAFVCHDQSHLAPGNHADAHLEGILGGVSAQPGSQAAAHHLAHQGHQDQK